MLLKFTITECPDLFTVADYKYVLKNVEQHFLDECKIQGIQVLYMKPFYNPELNEGLIDYDFINFDEPADIREMDLPISYHYMKIIFK